MNGVHCQTSDTMIAQSGAWLIQSGGGFSDPNRLPDPRQEAVEQAVLGVVEGVLPEQRRRHRDHEERCDHHGADQAAADELAVQQQGDAQPEDQADQDHETVRMIGDDDRGPAMFASVRTRRKLSSPAKPVSSG